MPTITLTPTACTASASWQDLRYYGNSSGLRQLIFTIPNNPTLGGAGINITGIALYGYVRNSSSAVKRLRFGCKAGAGAAPGAWAQAGGADVLDSAINAAPAAERTGTYSYYRFGRALTGAALGRFAAHMQAQFAAGSAVYIGVVQPDQGKSIQVNPALPNWQVQVTYELLGNVPSANVNTATLGNTAIKTTLNKVISGSSTTIRYKIGSATLATYNIGTGAMHTYTVPTSAGSNFPNSKTATLTIEAETFVGSASYGTISTSVTLNLPGDAAPTATCTLSRTWVSGVASSAQIAAYVQSKSGVSFALSGTAKYGASIASYRLTIENKTYTRTGNGSITHSPIAGSGVISYSYTVIDSRGLSRSYSGQISALAWSSPKVSKFTVERVTSGGDLAVDGTYARVTVQATASTLPVDGAQKNSIAYYVQYRQAGTPAWTNGDTATVTGGTSVNQSFMLKKGGANVGTFDDMTGYEFRLVLSDIYASVNALDEMPTKETYWDVNETNGSMGFGGEATGTGSTPQYDFYGRINARNGIIGGTRYSMGEVDTGNNWIDGKRIYARMFTAETPSTADNQSYLAAAMGGMDAVWIDTSATFFARKDTGQVYPHGYVAGDGGRQFMVSPDPANDRFVVVSDAAGTVYIRLLYTKS